MAEEEIKKYFENAEFSLKEFFKLILKRRKVFELTLFLGLALTVIFILVQKTTYKSTVLLLIEKPGESALTQSREIITITDFDESYYQTQYEIMKSRNLLQRVAERLELEKLPEFAESKNVIENFSKIIEVEPIRRTRLVKLSVLYKDPVMATTMANVLAGLYVQQNIENLLFMSKEVLKVFPKSAEDIARKTIFGEIEDLSKEDLISSVPAIINNPIIQEIKKKKVNVESEIADLSKRYKKKHPNMIALVNKSKYLDEQLEAETERIISGLRAELAGKFQANNIRIIDYAYIPQKPAYPRKKMILAIGLFLSTFLGISLIFFMEFIENKIDTREDVERELRLPVLGEIFLLKDMRNTALKFSYILQNLKHNDRFKEAVETLKTNLTFAIPKKEPVILLVSSSIPSEGKTFSAAIIATSFAGEGKKVLLLDIDMRKPGVNRIFDIEPSPGFSDLVKGKHDIESCVKETSVPGLYILPTGSRVSNPPQLLKQKKVREIIDEIKGKFDYIILDTPPTAMFIDTAIVSTMCDAFILVVRSGYADREVVKNLIKDLKQKNIAVVGVILNFLDLAKHAYSSYYYYHKAYKDYYDKDKRENSPEATS